MAPTKILSCPSIGGFVSHCGWSSIMESMYFGVPVIAMPIKFDQPINARLLVEASAGVEVRRDENGLFSAKAVAEAINKVIMETNGEDLRNGARKLSQKMKNEQEQAENEAAQELLWLCKKSKQ
ncbi:UNVERIFIED_CONTAM: UDP-glucosyltransferase 29 [Sesamum radiatum]|uniref:UDP-glucosyltransferase 29 n=1 Tax=Sesamum radiatum TaxID=300843 RepID=A0AAW2S8I3_SESRA